MWLCRLCIAMLSANNLSVYLPEVVAGDIRPTVDGHDGIVLQHNHAKQFVNGLPILQLQNPEGAHVWCPWSSLSKCLPQKAIVLPCHHCAGAPQDLLTALGRHLAAWNKGLADVALKFGQAIQLSWCRIQVRFTAGFLLSHVSIPLSKATA